MKLLNAAMDPLHWLVHHRCNRDGNHDATVLISQEPTTLTYVVLWRNQPGSCSSDLHHTMLRQSLRWRTPKYSVQLISNFNDCLYNNNHIPALLSCWTRLIWPASPPCHCSDEPECCERPEAEMQHHSSCGQDDSRSHWHRCNDHQLHLCSARHRNNYRDAQNLKSLQTFFQRSCYSIVDLFWAQLWRQRSIVKDIPVPFSYILTIGEVQSAAGITWQCDNI